MNLFEHMMSDEPVGPLVKEYIGKDNVLLAGCIRCLDSTIIRTHEQLSSWYDDETDHIACRDCGPKYGVGVLVAEIVDEAAARKTFLRWVMMLSTLSCIERVES